MIVQLHAGLGNQMFRYAFGRSVSIARNEPVLFKKVGLGPGEVRAYGLDAYNIQADFTNDEGDYTYEEKVSNIFDPGVYTAPSKGYFVGNWQTEKYFNEPVIRHEFTIKRSISDGAMRMADQIMSAHKSAFVHVRRSGDYGLPEIQAIFGGLDMRYYNAGIRYIMEREQDVRFFIITDDVNWCREQFSGVTIIGSGVSTGDTGPLIETEDLWLMSLCNHAVIPSSSFGWWGAWLGDERRPRIVVTPENWYKIKMRDNRWVYDSRDMIPERWVKLRYE